MKLQFLLGSIVVAGLLASAPNAASHGGFGGGGAGGFHGGGGFNGGGHFAGFHGRDHFFGRGRFFGTGFGFYGYGYPWWDWDYPYYPYYPYPYYDYDAYYGNPYYGNGDPRSFWQDLARKVQSELARRGYYHGQINGVIDSDSRQAIRAFQKAQGLPVTGLIDPGVLRALKLPVPQIPSRSS